MLPQDETTIVTTVQSLYESLKSQPGFGLTRKRSNPEEVLQTSVV